MTEEQIKTIAARIAKGHGIPMENAVFITRQVLRLAHHYPHVPNLDEMTTINGSNYRGTVDLKEPAP